MAATKGMIFLEPGNRILADVVAKQIEAATDPDLKLEPLRDRISDFDGAVFTIVADKATANIVSVSLSTPCFAELAMSGAGEIVEEEYGPLLSEPRDGADVTLEFDVTALPCAADALVEKVSRLKRVVVGAPFTRAFRALAAGTSGELPASHIHHHGAESLFVIPRPDRVTVVYGMEFSDITDRAMARVIALEFVEAQRHVNGAPAVSFTKDPPMELAGLSLPVTPSFVGFLGFGVFPKHVSTPEKLDLAVSLMSGFRNYVHYHIKAAKSFLHMRMRHRVDAMLGVLKRAIPVEENKEKKLMDGRTFVRKV